MKKIIIVIIFIVGIVAVIGFTYGSIVLGDIVWSRFIMGDSLSKSNRAAGPEDCAEISPNSFQTALFFNNEYNQYTHYIQSRCYQRFAIDNRDAELCDHVREREVLFFDGSYHSKQSCLAKVQAGIDEDYSNRIDPATIHDIDEIDLVKQGDEAYSVKLSTTGSLSGTYSLAYLLFDNDKNLLGQLHETKTGMGQENDNTLSYQITRHYVGEVAGYDVTGKSFVLQVKLTLVRDHGNDIEHSELTQADLISVKEKAFSF